MTVPTDLTQRLRALRTEERRLRSSLVEDLRSFQKPDLSFFTLPDSKIDEKISVATTCTALMALIDSNDIRALLPKIPSATKLKPQVKAVEIPSPEISLSEVRRKWKELFTRVVAGTWKSSDLPDLNAFTKCMVVRATGFLASSAVLPWAEARILKHALPSPDETKSSTKTASDAKKELSLDEIIVDAAERAPESFAVSGYPPKTTLGYWFVHGITKAQISIPPSAWNKIASWAAREFYQQLTYVVSGNDPLMDPASLAMAACLISRISKTAAEKAELSSISEGLPSRVELTHAIEKVFDEQAESGIWPKAFPLFHFPGSGAADYCFSFEFLEAILIEFSEFEIAATLPILNGLEKAIRWCSDHRFAFHQGERNFNGWNAGGEVTKLAAGMPEAWATSVVHMFLWELDSSLSQCLQKSILTRFHGKRPPVEKWKELIDVDLIFPGGEQDTLMEVVDRELIVPAVNTGEALLRKQPLTSRRSALLFGPPGTSKTTLARATAGKLSWSLLIITPSDFLSKGLEQIYVRATEIFEDLMDLSGVVILFDEMDALAQTRGNPALDVTRQLLTTSMLPKLADLHDQGRVIFLMATNHKKDLDPAITRPGRFDLLLCVGPPSWERKLKGIFQVLKESPTGDLKEVAARLGKLSDSVETKKELDFFTVADLRNFLEHLRRRAGTETLASALKALEKRKFKQDVQAWSRDYITLNKNEEELLKEFKKDKNASRIQ